MNKKSARQHTYEPVGSCIYCGAQSWDGTRTRRLGNEHVIPEGLGGKILLPEASCRECERITNSFEQPILKGTYHVARKQMGIKGKRRGVPPPISLEVIVAGVRTTFSIPVDDYPGVIVTLTLSTPRALLGLPIIEETITGGVAIATLPDFGPKLEKFRRLGDVRLEPVRGDNDSTKLSRMLAKISHSYAVGERGLASFRPLLLPLISGKDILHASHYVGGTYDEKLSPTDTLYEISLTDQRAPDGQLYLVCNLRLYSHFSGMPRYLIVVGAYD